MKAIRRYLVSRAPEAGGVRARLDALFDGSDASGLGLLLNERVVNMPPELAPAIQVRVLGGWVGGGHRPVAADRADVRPPGVGRAAGRPSHDQ